jgi:hypothetical protein
MWIWIAVVVLALVILGAATVPLVGRLSALQRAAARLQRRQAEAMKLQQSAAMLEQTLLGLQQRAELTQERIEAIAPGLIEKWSSQFRLGGGTVRRSSPVVRDFRG